MAYPERHPTTAAAWKWLEDGPGKRRSEVNQAQIHLQLAELDAALWALDRTAPTSGASARVSGLTLEQLTAAWRVMLAAVREESESTL